MATQYVTYCTSVRLSCAGASVQDVILCLQDSALVALNVCPDQNLTTYTQSFIEATICQFYNASDSCGSAAWTYTFSYDDTQLADPTVPLAPGDITGVFCKNCQTTWTEEKIGNEPFVRTELDATQTFVSPHGCEYPLVVTSTDIFGFNAQNYGDGSCTDETIQAAITAIGVQDAVLYLLPCTWIIDNDLTIPSNIELNPIKGAVLDIATGITLTFANGSPFKTDLVQVFSGLGEVVFGEGSVEAARAEWFGRDNVAIQKAINSSRNVVVGDGVWDFSAEVSNVNHYQSLILNAGTTLRPIVGNITLIHWSASYGYYEGGNHKVDINGQTGISVLRVTPLSESQTTTLVQQNWNVFRDFVVEGAADEKIVLQCGPDVAGADSGCFYNSFFNILGRGCIRNIWLKDGPNIGSSGNNRNRFYNCDGNSGGLATANTGVQIDSGDTNRFYSCHYEGIGFGILPNAIPTAQIVNHNGLFSGDNNDNQFIGFSYEANILDIFNDNDYTRVDGEYLTFNFVRNPRWSIGQDLSSVPWFLSDAILMQTNGQIPGNINGININLDIALKTNHRIYDYGFDRAVYPITVAVCTNVASIAEHHSEYQQVSGIVDWHFRFQFMATIGINPITVQFPILPDDNLYRFNSLNGTMTLGAWVNNGSGLQFVPVDFSSSATIPATLTFTLNSGVWDIGGANNSIDFCVRYFI